MLKFENARGFVLLICCLAFSGIARGQDINCNMNLSNHYGPFNFYAASKSRNDAVRLVTSAHLTPEMLALSRGKTDTRIAPDLDYTLAVIPNHPQALDLASRLDRAVKTGSRPRTDKLKREVNCYFRRALSLAPQTSETFYVWGIHYHRNDEFQESLKMYKEAERLGASSPEFFYNMGLLYMDMRDYERAAECADIAYGRNYPLQGLRSKLEKQGVW